MKNDRLSLDVVRDIIVSEIDILPERVNIYNQKFVIPAVDGLFIYLEYRGTPTIISSRNVTELVDGEYTEVQDVCTSEDICIGLFSKNLDALKYKEKVVMALFSVFSQQTQELESFRIFNHPKIAVLSEVEATARLYRVDIDFKIHAWYHNAKTAKFYDNFTTHVVVNDGTPDLVRDFSIPNSDITAYPIA